VTQLGVEHIASNKKTAPRRLLNGFGLSLSVVSESLQVIAVLFVSQIPFDAVNKAESLLPNF
jgi:hypothetical protein